MRKICVGIFLFLCLSNTAISASEIGTVQEAVNAALNNAEPDYLQTLMNEFTQQVYEFTLENDMHTPRKQIALYVAITSLLEDLYRIAESISGTDLEGFPSKSAWGLATKVFSQFHFRMHGLVNVNESKEYASRFAHAALKNYLASRGTCSPEQSKAILFRVSELKLLQFLMDSKTLLAHSFVYSQNYIGNFDDFTNPFENIRALQSFELSNYGFLEENSSHDATFFKWFKVLRVLVVGNTMKTSSRKLPKRIQRTVYEDGLASS